MKIVIISIILILLGISIVDLGGDLNIRFSIKPNETNMDIVSSTLETTTTTLASSKWAINTSAADQYKTIVIYLKNETPLDNRFVDGKYYTQKADVSWNTFIARTNSTDLIVCEKSGELFQKVYNKDSNQFHIYWENIFNQKNYWYGNIASSYEERIILSTVYGGFCFPPMANTSIVLNTLTENTCCNLDGLCTKYYVGTGYSVYCEAK